MSFSTEQNKQTVVRFNKEFIRDGKTEAFEQLLSEKVVNHSAPEGMPNGKESFYFFLNNVLRKGFSNLEVEILDQVAERDLVCTRKKITGTHTGEIWGIPPSNKAVVIHVIDMIRLSDGKYIEHWGQSNFAEVIKLISE